MNSVKHLKSFLQLDYYNVLRDPLLRWLVLFPVLIIVIIRWGIPELRDTLFEQSRFELEVYYELICSFLVLIMPIISGTVIGFLLLDQKDEQTIDALQVTPISMQSYLMYRNTLPMIISFVMTLVMLPLMGISNISIDKLVFVSIAAAPLAPIFALILAIGANNKVEGFAISKILGILNWPPIIAYFVPDSFQWIFWVIPTYWPVLAYWLADDNAVLSFHISWITGLLINLVILFVLGKAFKNRLNE